MCWNMVTMLPVEKGVGAKNRRMECGAMCGTLWEGDLWVLYEVVFELVPV